jgi:hypothetical protein
VANFSSRRSLSAGLSIVALAKMEASAKADVFVAESEKSRIFLPVLRKYFQTFHIIFRTFSNIFKRFRTFSNVFERFYFAYLA